MSATTSSPDVPPFYGYVETTSNALRLIHAARQGIIPRITRRLNDTERRTMIKSGAVFVFSVEESGIKRWTDGLLWSPSRIVGNFLVYREINERASSRGTHKKSYTTEESPRSLSLHRSDQGTFKPGGLIKKTITVTIEGSDLHLISYYTTEDIRSGKLKRPSTRHDIMSLSMPPHLFRQTNFRVPPKVEIGPDGKSRLVPEPEEPEPLECKIEEGTYSIAGSPPSSASSASPIDNPHSGSSLYPVPQVGHSLAFSRTSTSDRWSENFEHMRVSSPVHNPGSWSTMSNSANRRDATTDWVSSLPTHSSRWQGDSYDNTYMDRHRVRLGNPYIPSLATRDETPAGGRFGPSGISRPREITSQRLPWMLSGDSTSDKDARAGHARSSSFHSHTTNGHFGTDGAYSSYSTTSGSAWSPSDNNSFEHTQPAFSSHLYDPSYVSPTVKTEYTGGSYPDA